MSATDTHMEIIENARLDDVRPGDHLTWARTKVLGGVTSTESHEGIAHHHDGDGDWITKDGVWITDAARTGFTLTIRRLVKELPPKLGAFIVPAPGHETITATDPVTGTVWRTREAVCTGLSHWMGVWRDEAGTFSSVMPAGWITTDTWQEGNA